MVWIFLVGPVDSLALKRLDRGKRNWFERNFMRFFSVAILALSSRRFGNGVIPTRWWKSACLPTEKISHSPMRYYLFAVSPLFGSTV